jgi:hypothetical protein
MASPTVTLNNGKSFPILGLGGFNLFHVKTFNDFFKRFFAKMTKNEFQFAI